MDQFVGEIALFPFGFAPKGWALCNGQLLPINQNQALFSLLGTTFGGDGQTTFGLPNLQSRVPVGAGQGQGLSSYPLGQLGGAEGITLLTAQMAAHTHGAAAANSGNNSNPTSAIWAPSTKSDNLYSTAASDGQMNPANIATFGAGQPHPNVMPYQTLSFAIALTGVFPSRS